jgi:hypothetical protein
MASLSDNYQYGDLIYGLSDVRADYRHKVLMLDHDCYATIDEYHKWMFPDSQVDHNAWETYVKMDEVARNDMLLKVDKVENSKSTCWAVKGEKVSKNQLSPAHQQHQTKTMSLKSYFEDLSKSKYDPKKLSRQLKDDAFKEKLAMQTTDSAKQRYYLAIRRSCKHGLLYVCNNTALGIKVHFLLDKINLLTILKRELDKGRLIITGSELRCAHRNWGKMKISGKVLFYLKGEQVAAPWESEARADAGRFSDIATLCPGYGAPDIWDAEKLKRRKAKYGAGVAAALDLLTSNSSNVANATSSSASLDTDADLIEDDLNAMLQALEDTN